MRHEEHEEHEEAFFYFLSFVAFVSFVVKDRSNIGERPLEPSDRAQGREVARFEPPLFRVAREKSDRAQGREVARFEPALFRVARETPIDVGRRIAKAGNLRMPIVSAARKRVIVK